jgi:6-phosphogluconolactonase (cycloisomerase 2 family)
MFQRYKRIAAAVALSAALTAVAAGSAAASPPGASGGAVFVQTDNPAGNSIVAYRRGADGLLTQTGRFATGGLGGILTGSVTDHLASQSSLVYDRLHGLLFAVNAGSNTVSVFAVHGTDLELRQVIASGGSFPVSIAVHGDLAYVLNARDGGRLQGYVIVAGRLVALSDSSRALGLDVTLTPEFVNTPGQVGFTPDGSRLIVTTKANGNNVDVFAVGRTGRLSATPAVNNEAGTVPFAFTFDASQHLVLTEAGTGDVVTFELRGGTLIALSSVATGQTATCWITIDGPFAFASNTGSSTLSSVRTGPGGSLTLFATTPTDGGTVDSATSPDGRFLYVQTGAAGILDTFRVGTDGSLNNVAGTTVDGAVGGEGIAAT